MTNVSQHQIQYVTNFEDLVSASFEGEQNAICWSRNLEGDFSEIVQKITLIENIEVLNREDLLELQLSEQGQLARNIILQDMELLTALGASPVLNLIRCYDRDDTNPVFATDVYSFHVDRSPIPTSTFLCTYAGEPSELISNAQAEQKTGIPELRTELRKQYHGTDEGFESFLREHFYDLHYQAKPGATPMSLGMGHLWRLAVDFPESQSLPCIHRAPIEKPGALRLLLIC